MKKLSLLALSLISSVSGLYAKEGKEKKPVCTQVKELDGPIAGKLFCDSLLLLTTKISLPAGIIAIASPLLNEVTKETAQNILENPELYNIDNPMLVKFISKSTNGWNQIGAAFALYFAGYLYYTRTSFRDLTPTEKDTLVTNVLYAWLASRLVTIAASRHVQNESILPSFN